MPAVPPCLTRTSKGTIRCLVCLNENYSYRCTVIVSTVRSSRRVHDTWGKGTHETCVATRDAIRYRSQRHGRSGRGLASNHILFRLYTVPTSPPSSLSGLIKMCIRYCCYGVWFSLPEPCCISPLSLPHTPDIHGVFSSYDTYHPPYFF